VIDIKSDAALEAMREAGRVVAVALAAVRSEAAIGVSLADLDEVAHEVLRKAGADAIPRGDLRVGQRRNRARHPGRLPAGRR